MMVLCKTHHLGKEVHQDGYFLGWKLPDLFQGCWQCEIDKLNESVTKLQAKLDISENWQSIQKGTSDFMKGKPPELLEKINRLIDEFAEMEKKAGNYDKLLAIVRRFRSELSILISNGRTGASLWKLINDFNARLEEDGFTEAGT